VHEAIPDEVDLVCKGIEHLGMLVLDLEPQQLHTLIIVGQSKKSLACAKADTAFSSRECQVSVTAAVLLALLSSRERRRISAQIVKIGMKHLNRAAMHGKTMATWRPLSIGG
jgi:hypothetical protein